MIFWSIFLTADVYFTMYQYQQRTGRFLFLTITHLACFL